MTDGLNNKVAVVLDKLDQILTAIGSPPEVTATLDDLLAVMQDIHTDTQSMDGKLLTIRNTLIGPDEPALPSNDSYHSLAWNVYRLRRAIATDSFPAPSGVSPLQPNFQQFWSEYYTQTAVIIAGLNDLRNYVFYGLMNLGLTVNDSSTQYTGFLSSLLTKIDTISGSIGLPSEAGNRDEIQLLAKIADRPESQIGSGLAPYDVCADAYISSGMVLVPLGVTQVLESTIWAEFPSPPPPSISFGSAFNLGLDSDTTELVPVSGSWLGWKVYVASSASNFGVYVGTDAIALHRFPTNVWIDIGNYTYHLSFFVSASESLRVYLCSGGWGPGGGGGGPWGGGGGGGGGDWGNCVTLLSSECIVTQPNNSTNTIQYIPMSSIPGATYTNTITVQGGGTFTFNKNDYAATNNWNGVTVKLVYGGGVRVYYQKSDLSFVVHVFQAPDETYTIQEDTISAAIDDFTGGTVSQFSVTICPAGVAP